MVSKITINGIYPVEAKDPCHLFEVTIIDPDDEFDWGSVTQEIEDQPMENWQAAYDEQLLEENGDEKRWAFFFHYLNFSKPLISSFGNLELPNPIEIPSRLENIRYDPVD